MIRNHQFHSSWRGEPVGIVDDQRFLLLPGEERQRLLGEFAWVELRVPMNEASPRNLAAAGFIHVDTQIPFRIGLRRVTSGPSLDNLTADSAADHPFTIAPGDAAPFSHERFRHLPGITPEAIEDRFDRWANLAVEAAPQWCLRIASGGVTQGWFLSRQSEEGLQLDLAMLHRQATLSGAYLYRKALRTYASLGARVGLARFSVENTAVMNIYASLGAQFLPPIGIWLWTRENPTSGHTSGASDPTISLMT